MTSSFMVCPHCRAIMHPPFVALSRRDNRTEICSNCGRREGLEALMRSVGREVNDAG